MKLKKKWSLKIYIPYQTSKFDKPKLIIYRYVYNSNGSPQSN